MKGLRISIAAGLLAATIAVWIAGCSSYLPGPAANTQSEKAETQPGLQPEVVVIAPSPEPPVMDTVVVMADRDASAGTAAQNKSAPGPEAVIGAGAGSAPAVRKPIVGYAPGPQPGTRNQNAPFYTQHFEQ
jgi:FlaG/FlaF family flagellin (archaellin)